MIPRKAKPRRNHSTFFTSKPVLDFLAILLSGAVAAAILAPRIGPLIVGPQIDIPAEPAQRAPQAYIYQALII